LAKKNYSFDKIDVSNTFPTISTHVDWEPRTNIIEADNGEMWIIEVELPGVKKEDVSIMVENETHLIIRGTKRQPRTDDPKHLNYYLFEREFGSFYKRIGITFPLDIANIKSDMENGVLTVKIPRKKPGRILVEVK